MPQHLAIVPAYNEEGAVGATVADLREHAPDFDVLVIDDGSTDATAAAARRAGARVLRLPINLGIGGAVQTGYQFALEHGYDVAVQVDGDGQHDAREINKLLAYLDAHPELGMVTGSRFLNDDTTEGYRSSASRRARLSCNPRLDVHSDGPLDVRVVCRRKRGVTARSFG